MGEITAGQAVARVLKEEGVEFISGVHGGHIWGMLKPIADEGIRMIHCRHEQSGAYIADGWGRITGRPGVCFGTAGPGMFNLVSGLSHAYLCRSPVVALVGQHAIADDGRTPFQEGYAEEVCKSYTKWTKRILHTSQISYFVQKAFRDAATYPPGPVVIEFPTNILREAAVDESVQRGYLPKERCADLGGGGGDPVMVEKAVRMLLEAERPVVIGGDGIHYSKAQEELKEFVELLRIPVHTRRMGRGSVPENHPLAFTGGYRRPLLNHADVITVFGLRMGMLESFGEPPTYSHEAKYILVSESTDDLDARVPTEVRLLANPKVVLRQMIDCAKDLMKKPPERTEWLDEVTKAREAAQEATRKQVEEVRNESPIHPHFLAQEVVDFVDDSATMILDGFSLSGFITDKVTAKFSGQLLDSATHGGVGHGIGMGIGAQLARPGKQVVALMGDGGFGVAGFDAETAARYNLPVCFFLFNNSGWMGAELQKVALPIKDSWGTLTDIRYDKMFEEMGCHGEFVTKPEEMRPALERAFNSGKPSVINIIPMDILPPQTRARVTERR
ncbi:thiamine pyrophosphate-binding protein [Chloroflexota bacterium]